MKHITTRRVDGLREPPPAWGRELKQPLPEERRYLGKPPPAWGRELKLRQRVVGGPGWDAAPCVGA